MSDKNFWDFMLAVAQGWSVWYTVVIILAVLLTFGVINPDTITVWIKAAGSLVK